VLADELAGEQPDPSPLGVGWADELVARVSAPVPPGRLRAAGWLPLRVLSGRLGAAGDRWAVREDGVVLAQVRLVRDARPADPVAHVLARCERHGEVRLRDVLELCALRREGHPFPDASAALTSAADIEVGLGSRDLVRWTSGRSADAPSPLPRRRGRRRVVVAVSGVDGAGKSTLLAAVTRDLRRCDVPVSRVWLRPGMGLGGLSALAQRVKRRRGTDSRPGIALVAAEPERTLASRRGVQGWVWSLLVTTAFLVGVRRQHARATGVVLYDRHLLDALVTLDFAYSGADLRLQRWLVRRLVPRADLALHLDVPLEVAVARKPGDPIGAQAVRRQLEAYAEWAPRLPAAVRLDATEDPAVLAAEAFTRVVTL
jgi:thymidylate kinase